MIAHHYARYLGDLSGCQIIVWMVGNHYGVDPDTLSFYRFDELGKLKPYKDNYRAVLDGLVLAGRERNALLDEAHQVFILN